MDDTRPMHQIATSYDAMAEVYAERFGDVGLQHPLDRAVFSGFAGLLERDGATAIAVADLGCGPGHWSAELASYGFDVVGIDGSAGLLAIARSRHPEVTFEQGDLGALALDDRSLDGAVAWFSLIHTEPEALDRPLRELARVLRPGGLLLTGFQVGDGTEPEASTTGSSGRGAGPSTPCPGDWRRPGSRRWREASGGRWRVSASPVVTSSHAGRADEARDGRRPRTDTSGPLPGKGAGRTCRASGGQRRTGCFLTMSSEDQRRPKPKVLPAPRAARATRLMAPRMWSSMTGLFSGGRTTVHIIT